MPGAVLAGVGLWAGVWTPSAGGPLVGAAGFLCPLVTGHGYLTSPGVVWYSRVRTCVRLRAY